MSLQRVAIGGCLTAAAVFAWLFYSRYWRWRDCIAASASSCITPDGDNLTSGGLIWGLIAAIFAAGALRLALRGRPG